MKSQGPASPEMAEHLPGSPSIRILIVEDDRTISRSLVQGFTELGHDCVLATTGDGCLDLITKEQFDVIVLDLMLPGRHGLDVLSELRNDHVETPVLVLTALDSVNDRVRGLQNGADDYLVKPFAFAELQARVEALYRRKNGRPTTIRRSGRLHLDLTTRRVSIGQREIDLTPTEFSLLELLMRHSDQIVTRQMLCEHVWGFRWDGSTNVIEVHVNHLRKKLQREEGSPVIETVRGRGYVLHPS